MMKARNIENTLALVGAVIVLIGVSFAAEDALATDNANNTYTVASTTLVNAKQATSEAAEQAARSLARDNWIDLDIKLEDHTSKQVADER